MSDEIEVDSAFAAETGQPQAAKAGGDGVEEMDTEEQERLFGYHEVDEDGNEVNATAWQR